MSDDTKIATGSAPAAPPDSDASLCANCGKARDEHVTHKRRNGVEHLWCFEFHDTLSEAKRWMVYTPESDSCGSAPAAPRNTRRRAVEKMLATLDMAAKNEMLADAGEFDLDLDEFMAIREVLRDARDAGPLLAPPSHREMK